MSNSNKDTSKPKLTSKAEIKSSKRRKKSDEIDFNVPVKKQRILTVVNPETGEVEARVQLRDRLWSGGWFAFFQKSAAYLAENLNGEQFRVFMFMLTKIDYGNYVRVTNKVISRNLNMKHENVSRAIRGLIEKNIIVVEDTFGISRIYRVNPTFLHKGRDYYKTHSEYAQIREEALTAAKKDGDDDNEDEAS